MRWSAKRLALDAVLLAVSALAAYVESAVSLLPGVHLGLAHVCVMLVFLRISPLDALFISLVRVVCVNLLFFGASAFFISLCGTLLSYLAILLSHRVCGRIGIGIASSAMHAVGQVTAASLLYGTHGLFFSYLPLMLLCNLPLGALSGLILYTTETKGARLFEKNAL